MLSVRLLMILTLGLVLSGCRTVQTIMAHTVFVPANRTFIYGDVGVIEGRTASDARGRDESEQLRDEAFTFEAVKEKDFSIFYEEDGPGFTISMVAVSQNSPESRFPEPVEITIETISAHGLNFAARDGVAEIRFGYGGPVYSTSVSGGHFEFLVSEIFENNGDTFASGTFTLIAKNVNDSFSNDRLFVMDGAYICRVKNAQ